MLSVALLLHAGSADFSTPYGYNTNLMVYGPGGYRFMDYVKFGLPLQFICAFFSIGVILTLDMWWIWALFTLALDVVAVAILVLVSKRRHGRKRRIADVPLDTLTPTRTDDDRSDEDTAFDDAAGRREGPAKLAFPRLGRMWPGRSSRPSKSLASGRAASSSEPEPDSSTVTLLDPTTSL